MATDFREERKWKAAVAFELALAVQEWHRAPAEGEGSKAELSVGGRAWGNGGITSLLGRPGPGPSRAAANNDPRSGADGDKPLHAAADEVMVELEQREQEEEVAAELAVKQEEDDLAAWTQAKSKAASEVAVANASDEEDEDADGEVDDSMEVQQPGDVDMQGELPAVTRPSNRLKVFCAALPEQPARPGADAATRQSRVITGASAGQTLVAEDDQVEPLDPALAKELRVSLVAAGPATTSYNPAALGPAEPSLEELFPDLTAYAPPVPPTDDRVEQRIDQSTSWASRLTHTSRLMDVRPVLVSTLQPSKNRHPSGRWDHIDDGTMYDDTFDHEEWKQSSTGPMSNSTARKWDCRPWTERSLTSRMHSHLWRQGQAPSPSRGEGQARSGTAKAKAGGRTARTRVGRERRRGSQRARRGLPPELVTDRRSVQLGKDYHIHR